MATWKTLIKCPTCKSIKPMGEMETHCCCTCKRWEPLKRKKGLGLCTQGGVLDMVLQFPRTTPGHFGCIEHSDALLGMEKKEVHIRKNSKKKEIQSCEK